MPQENLIQTKLFPKERRKGERRKTVRRIEDQVRGEAQNTKARKLHSLLELGRLIGSGSSTQ